MSSDYAAIRIDNQRRYGTDIARIGQMLLADRYDDRTHFIYELLQNAEDALVRRVGWFGSRAVQFHLNADALHLSHFGRPFDDRDVRGICGIAESTKDRTAIGRFGIGFKSVYAYTTRPEVHSGAEDFAIESFVWPIASRHMHRQKDETLIVLPLNAGLSSARDEIARGLQRLGPGTLLFLREIEEIEWRVEGGASGVYLRSKPDILGPGVRRITVIGQEAGMDDTEESWLIFFREVSTDDGTIVGQVEVAFSMVIGDNHDDYLIQPVSHSPLVVFFPTVVPTSLGFLVQGPYRPTPSRDNVPRNDLWNQHLVNETTLVVANALAWLRDERRLDVSAFRCLPLDKTKFPEDSMFAPLFKSVLTQMKSERLLPSSTGSYVTASAARLARTHELRQLFDSRQLGALFGITEELAWLNGDISQDRTPDIRQYLMRELGIAEVTPEMVLPRLSKPFLEAQPDEWIQRLYEFLQGQPAIVRGGRLQTIPVIRLADGTHVIACKDGQLQAFLPSAIETGFPTVRKAVCASEEARRFLESLGLTEPDPVDDVIWNLLPKYREQEVDVSDETYHADIRRILDAFKTDSKTQREKLLTALRDTCFAMAVDAGDGSKCVSDPAELYSATARLKDLFRGVKDVFLVDDEYDCLRGEDIRELLEACGASRSLQPVAVDPDLSWVQRRELRIAGGCESSSGGERITDFSLRGLDQLLALLPSLDAPARSEKAALLWDALGDLEDRRGASVFSGKYEWTYHKWRSTSFDSSFIRKLNQTPWVPAKDGTLSTPSTILFETLGWKANPFLLSKISFKPPIIEMLAKEAGIDPGVLDLLKKIGITSEAELRCRLGVKDDADFGHDQDKGSVPDASGDSDAEEMSGGGVEADNNGIRTDEPDEGSGSHRGLADARSAPGNGIEPNESGRSAAGRGGREQCSGDGSRPFISYIGTHPDSDEGGHDPDGLDHEARMKLEMKAIELILSREPRLMRTPMHNRGFDLYEPGEDDRPIRWVEVKAMTGGLDSRSVCMSRAQFDCAWKHGEAYWLYVVEYAGDDGKARLLRIKDPAGKARYFTFDQGWELVAEVCADDPERGGQ